MAEHGRVVHTGPKESRSRIFKFALMDAAESVRARIADPSDRSPSVEAAVEQVGGKLLHAWVTLTDYDAVVIAELPDEIAANALWNLFKAGGAVEKVSIEPMISLHDHIEALRVASQLEYDAPQGRTWEPSEFRGERIVGSDRVLYTGTGGRASQFIIELANCNPDSIRAMVSDPHDRTPAVEAAIKQVGGTLHHVWATLSEFDTIVIAELPDGIAAGALWSVFKAGAGVVRLAMHPIITLDEHVEALKLAAQIEYLPPQGKRPDRPQFAALTR